MRFVWCKKLFCLKFFLPEHETILIFIISFVIGCGFFFNRSFTFSQAALALDLYQLIQSQFHVLFLSNPIYAVLVLFFFLIKMLTEIFIKSNSGLVVVVFFATN